MGNTAAVPRLGADGKVHARAEIANSWKPGAHGVVIEAINLAPVAKGAPPHEPHDITVYGGVLICDCQAYLFSKWTPTTAKECVHIVGNDGTDGTAAWLEVQSKRMDLDFWQRAIATASRTDPHRIYVRVEKERRAKERAACQETATEPGPPCQTASERVYGPASKHQLEQFFK